ncbi:hypothetical protein PNOK_0123900 [Pyrrhoderma noxium]|uniref:Uncharacterized protein n=1 Tax=Pyrrhoderma noxium TaxID=2282107 RepID=A0A286UX81_9AGAM|nr:hypothetical protein PNOK_0123900 [Pyrrhoderma noxium]
MSTISTSTSSETGLARRCLPAVELPEAPDMWIPEYPNGWWSSCFADVETHSTNDENALQLQLGDVTSDSESATSLGLNHITSGMANFFFA